MFSVDESGPKCFSLTLFRVEYGLSDGGLTTPRRQRPRMAAMRRQRRPPLGEKIRHHSGRYELSLAIIETRVGHDQNRSLTHLFTHLSLTVTRAPHSRTLCVFRHSSCVKGFVFVCTPKNVGGPAWRLCVVAFAARQLGSAARLVGSLE